MPTDPLSRLMELREKATRGRWTNHDGYPFEVCDCKGETIGEYMLVPSKDVANARLTVAEHNLTPAFVEVARMMADHCSHEKCATCRPALAALDAAIEKELGE